MGYLAGRLSWRRVSDYQVVTGYPRLLSRITVIIVLPANTFSPGVLTMSLEGLTN